MKVLLVKPCWPYPLSENDSTYNRIWPPLCLLNCAAILRKSNMAVSVLDAHAERISPAEIFKYIEGFDKIFITSSSLDRWQCPYLDIAPFLQTSRNIKQINDNIYVMGYHGTVNPEEILAQTEAKAVIRGEPEKTILELCQNKNLSEIRGITYKENGHIISNRPQEFIDLNALPIPAFDLIDTKKYYYEILGNNLTLFEASRGCIYKCAYCDKTMLGETYRTKSIEKLLGEIDLAINKFGITSGYFIDANFTANRILVEQVCEYLIKAKYNFTWCCQTRVDLIDKDLMVKMKKAGCALIHYGIETGSPRMLKKIHKDISLEKTAEIIEITRRTGIKTLCFFIFGLPDETADELKQTVSFIRRLDTNYVSFHFYYNYLDGNFASVGKRGLVFRNDLKRIMKEEYLYFYLRPKRLLKEVFETNIYLALKKLLLFYRYLKNFKMNKNI